MLQIYRCFTYFFYPLLVLLIYLRSIFNKEDKLRYKEKIFSSHFKVLKKNKKKLIWFHAVSIGECLSILPLIDELNKKNKSLIFLITTVTLSSSRLVEKKIKRNKNIIHRFFPIDNERLSENFLDGWKPNLICFVDSEIWPNFLFKIKEKNIPLLLLNARLTKKSYNNWLVISGFAKKVFRNFDLCIAASKESKNNLKKLNVRNLKYFGNLKYSTKAVSSHLKYVDKKKLNNYKTWCAASTHDGEENIVLKTHIEIKKKYKNILTIIIPRHISRVLFIKNLSKKLNLKTQILNNNDSINPEVEILIINSFGVMSKYFNYCKNVFIGKSFIKERERESGQNPIEAAKLGCKIFHGPYVYNFQEVYNLLKSYRIAEETKNEIELAQKIIKNIEVQKISSKKQINLLNKYGEKILKKTSEQFNRYLK